jgi:hypothetical protein
MFSDIIDRTLHRRDTNRAGLVIAWRVKNESTLRNWMIANVGMLASSPRYDWLIDKRARFSDAELLDILQTLAGDRATVTIVDRSELPSVPGAEHLREALRDVTREEHQLSEKGHVALADGRIDETERRELAEQSNRLNIRRSRLDRLMMCIPLLRRSA